jgi:hypothetical protein
MSLDLARLQDLFEPDDLGWKPIAVSKKTGKALVAAYVTNRAIMDRLDEVCAPENWRNEFKAGPNGGLLCGISIRVLRPDGSAEWITKWDGAENTDVEPVKGGISSSMRRAAVQWGIGRYLYRLPNTWCEVDERGRVTQTPALPLEFRPPRTAPPPVRHGDGMAGEAVPRPPRPASETPPPEPRRPESPGTARKRLDDDAARYFGPNGGEVPF